MTVRHLGNYYIAGQLSGLGFRLTPRLAPKLDAHGLFIAGLNRKQLLLPFLPQILLQIWALGRSGRLIGSTNLALLLFPAVR